MADCIRPAMAALEVEAAGLKAEDARALCSMLLLESVRDRMYGVPYGWYRESVRDRLLFVLRSSVE